jgi:hypothetical protein
VSGAWASTIAACLGSFIGSMLTDMHWRRKIRRGQ